jgi:hypothetical protein
LLALSIGILAAQADTEGRIGALGTLQLDGSIRGTLSRAAVLAAVTSCDRVLAPTRTICTNPAVLPVATLAEAVRALAMTNDPLRPS